MLNQATNAAVQYTTQATKFLDGIFTALSRDLQMTPAGVSASSGTGRSDTDGPELVSLLSAATGVSSSSQSDSAAIAALASSSTGPSSATASASGPSSRPDPINMLRALAAADVRSGADQAARRAGAVALVTASEVPAAAVPHAHGLSHSIGPGSGSTVGAGTAAAMAMATPRSAPALRRGAPATGPGPTADSAAGTMGRDVPNTAAGVAGTGGLRGRMYGRGTGQSSQ
jgi:kinetochore protein Mis13/DSN1